MEGANEPVEQCDNPRHPARCRCGWTHPMDDGPCSCRRAGLRNGHYDHCDA